MFGWDRLVDSTASKMPLLPAERAQNGQLAGDSLHGAKRMQPPARRHAGQSAQARVTCRLGSSCYTAGLVAHLAPFPPRPAAPWSQSPSPPRWCRSSCRGTPAQRSVVKRRAEVRSILAASPNRSGIHTDCRHEQFVDCFSQTWQRVAQHPAVGKCSWKKERAGGLTLP